MSKYQSIHQTRSLRNQSLRRFWGGVGVLTAAATFAQTPKTFSADDAVKIGLERNPQAAAAQAGVASAKSTYRSLASLPPITLGATQQQGKGNDSDTFLDLGEVLDLSGQRRYGAASANEQYKATFYQFRETLLTIEQQILDAYWTLAAARGQTQIAEVSLKEALRIFDLTVKQEQAGSSPKSDVVRSSIDVANAKQTLIAAQAADRSALITFNTLLAQPPTTPVELSSDLTQDTTALHVVLQNSLEDLNKRALAERPLVKSVSSQVLAAKYSVQQAESSRFPDLNMDFQKSVVHGTNLMVFSLSFPLLDFGSVGHSVRSAKELKKQADALKLQTEKEVSRQVAQAYTDLKFAVEAASSYKKDILDPSVTLLSMAQLGYQQGATGILPIIDAESTIRNARVGYITALLAVYKAQDEMQVALGSTSFATTPKKP